MEHVLSDLVDTKSNAKVSMDALMQLAFAACADEVTTWEEIMYHVCSKRGGAVVQHLITADQPKTQIPKPTKPQFPEVKIGETVETHVTLRSVERNLAASQEAVNFIAKLKFEAAAAEPPYTPHPTPNLLQGPRAPRNAGVKRAVAADTARQTGRGVKKQFPSVAHLAVVHLRMIAAGLAARGLSYPIWPA